MKAWIYSRLARDDDNGLQKQEETLCNYAVENGYTVVGKTSEVGSGNDFTRQGLKTLLDNTGEYDCLIMRDITRIGRNMPDVQKTIELLNSKGIKIITLDGIAI